MSNFNLNNDYHAAGVVFKIFMLYRWQFLKEDKVMQKNFIIRARIISLIREFFLKNKFLEVETPTIVACPGTEPHFNFFKTEISFGNKGMLACLTTSPEYAMKKLLAAGFSKIFQICRSYRNGEIGCFHNPEFTILEWYRSNADYKVIMNDVENIFLYILRSLYKQNQKSKIKNKKLGENFLIYQNQKIDLSLPWPRLTMKQVFEWVGINLDKVLDFKSLAAVAKKRGYTVNRGERFEDIFFKIFLNEIEPRLDRKRPLILMDWPAEMAALSKRKKSDPRYAERFEVYIGGLELANAFSELTDPIEQKKRLKKEQRLRKKMEKEVYNIDKEFIAALSSMPPSGGIAMGVDRMVMLFTDAKSIEEVLFFPAKQIFNL